jgi:hypothetical protein
MSDNVFDLVYSDYDWQEHYFFSGPEGTTLEDFKKLCDSLLPQAGYKATLKRSSPKSGGRICWSDVVESLVSLLEDQGYQRISIDSYSIDNTGFIIGLHEGDLDNRLGFSWQAIVSFNQKLEKKLSEERKAKRNLRLGTLKKKTVQIIK